MKQFNPFSEVSDKYGAPMGRRGDNPANLQGIKRLHARHQGGSGGYDRGGAYWGSPCNVWGYGHGLMESLSAPTFALILAWMLSIKYSKGWKHERTIKA